MEITPISGLSNITQFTLSSVDLDNVSIIWGDGTISDEINHTYETPGTYNIIVNGCSATDAADFTYTVCVSNYISPSVTISTPAVSSIAGVGETFTATVISTFDNITLNFYASGSDSRPYESPPKFWDHLDPRWRFLDTAGNIITTATFSGTPILYDTTVVAYSANYEFKYIDDMPKNVVLFVTQHIPDHNSRVYSAIQHAVSGEMPTSVKISEDGTNPIYFLQYAGIPIPYLITMSSDNSNLLHYVSANIISAEFSSICSVVSDQIYTETIPVLDSNSCFYTGGYLLTSTIIDPAQIPEPTVSIDPRECNNESDLIYSEYRIPARDAKITVVAEVSFNGNTATISGESDVFSIYPFSEYNKFRRIGESEDLGEHLKYYAFTERMRNHSMLWEYVDSIMGTDLESFGPRTYFSIEKFVDQHSDIDRCSIRSIIDSSKKMGVTIDDYSISDMPYSIKRILDIASMPLEKIVGTRSVFVSEDYSNIGDELTLTDYISAGQDILYKENGGSTVMETFHVMPQSTNVFLLSTLSATPFNNGGINNYCFFKINTDNLDTPIESEIDYLSEFTTINPQLSTAEDWFGDGGVIEELLNYNLIKGLGLDL